LDLSLNPITRSGEAMSISIEAQRMQTKDDLIPVPSSRDRVFSPNRGYTRKKDLDTFFFFNFSLIPPLCASRACLLGVTEYCIVLYCIVLYGNPFTSLPCKLSRVEPSRADQTSDHTSFLPSFPLNPQSILLYSTVSPQRERKNALEWRSVV
jgi:hypothetical protein